MRQILIFFILLVLAKNSYAKIVGVTLDHRENPNGENKFASTSFYGIRDNYISSFQKSCKKYGIVVLPIPLDQTMIPGYVETFDGLVFSGNYFDINPKLYGQKLLNSTVKIEETRKSDFEMKLFRSFYKTKKPIFGICGGYQMINVALGGELYQDIPSQVKDSNLNHSMSGKECAHKINILEKDGIFAKALLESKESEKNLCVNSSHHQSISAVAKELEIVATSPDGIIEGYKAKNHPFLIGVQWHPEYELTKFDTKLIDEFCSSVAKQR
jgi:putative glutamine amidotransferase